MVETQLNKALEKMKDQGATIVDNVIFNEWSKTYSKRDRAGWRRAFRLCLKESQYNPTSITSKSRQGSSCIKRHGKVSW
jgi:predicted O-methyltransferase YrrM